MSMRPLLALLALLAALTPGAATACGSCRPLVLAAIAAEVSWTVALGLAAPIVLLLLIAAAVHLAGRKP